METLKFCKIRDVKSPRRGNETDAGIDFFVPNDFPKTTLWQGEQILIPSGIKVEIPKGWMGCFFNKSGVATNLQLLVGAQVIDTGYSGEVHLNLHFTGLDMVDIEPGQKICQMILLPISDAQPQEVNESDLNHIGDRKSGGFGSTGVK